MSIGPTDVAGHDPVALNDDNNSQSQLSTGVSLVLILLGNGMTVVVGAFRGGGHGADHDNGDCVDEVTEDLNSGWYESIFPMLGRSLLYEAEEGRRVFCRDNPTDHI